MRAPANLGVRGRRFWRTITAEYGVESTPDLVEILTEACRVLDLCDGLEAAIAADGVTIPGSRGQSVVNPAVSELRHNRTLLGRLLSQLGISDQNDEPNVPSAGSVSGRKAAEARWRKARLKTENREANGWG